MNLQHIVITGASSGIGAALAEHYAHTIPNIQLSLIGRNQERLAAVAKKCANYGAAVQTQIACVTDRKAMEKLLQKIDKACPVDLIIANAGISGGTGTPNEIEYGDQVRDIFAVNVEGVFNTINPLVPAMAARKSGHIAIISSLAGVRGFAGAPAYCASKAAVKVYGEGLRGSLKPKGVQVHVVMPGFVRSPMTDVNDFPMPFMIEAPKAAKIIAEGITRGRGRIAFPRPMAAAVWFLGALPNRIVEVLTHKAPAKTVRPEG